jgi:prepilin peptidase CpaA
VADYPFLNCSVPPYKGMSVSLDIVPLAGFAGLMATAAVVDFRRLIIPNWIVLGLCALWPLHFAVASDLSLAAGLTAFGCAAAVFVAGALLFSRGLIGGGDVKLLSAATLWAGPSLTPALLFATALLGGLLTILLLVPLAMRTMFPPADAGAGAAKPGSVPYGIAIAAAALIVTLPPNLN